MKEYLDYIIEKLAVLIPAKIISISKHTTHKLKNELNSKKTHIHGPNGIEFDFIIKNQTSERKVWCHFCGQVDISQKYWCID